MPKNYAQRHDRIVGYAERTFAPEDSTLEDVRRRMAAEDLPMIQVGSMDGLHLEILARMSGARRAVEIGTLAGYSGICLLRGMGEGARLWTFELDPKHAEVARQSFQRAGLAENVDVRVDAATDQLVEIEDQGPFDLVFIDADKVGYPGYLSWAEKNLRCGGVVIGDNTFAFGHIGDENFTDPELEHSVRALREFNQRLARSGQFRATILPTGEGLTVGVKL